jgi:hypothetical protein
MKRNHILKFASRFCLVALLASGALSASHAAEVGSQGLTVDPAARQILKNMCDYLGGLDQFSVNTHNTIGDILESGQKIDIDVSAKATVSRPNKIRADRKGELIDQSFYYDGKTLTLYNPSDKVYATVPAPATIEGTLDYARDTLGLIIPVSDLVYSNSFPLLMKDVNFAMVVGKAVIDGVRCDHLLFSRPGVDFQVWVAEGGNPLPRKYVVTDTTLTTQLSLTTVMKDWNVAPAVPNSRFNFEAPKDATAITFLPLITTGATNP